MTGNYDGPLCPPSGGLKLTAHGDSASCFPNLGQAIVHANTGGKTTVVAGVEVAAAVAAAKAASAVVLAVDNFHDGGGEVRGVPHAPVSQHARHALDRHTHDQPAGVSYMYTECLGISNTERDGCCWWWWRRWFLVAGLHALRWQGHDRYTLSLSTEQLALANAVIAANPNTILVPTPVCQSAVCPFVYHIRSCYATIFSRHVIRLRLCCAQNCMGLIFIYNRWLLEEACDWNSPTFWCRPPKMDDEYTC
eukprot:COSAG05_NODE_752_length_7532_cov_44.503565_5_plen_250_part_00